MTTAVARGPLQPLAPSTSSPKPRVKKKVRMQEVIMGEELEKPVDTFHVEISDVQGVLRIVEPRPVLLTFEFDNYWYAETTVYAHDIHPKWNINASSIRGHDGRKPVTADGEHQTPARGVIPAAKFVYETEFGYKLHRKFLVVKLAERSPYGDVEWGTGTIPLDSIARGCQRTDISIFAKDNVTCYGNIHCNIKMVNIQKVRAHLTDLKLSDYPEAYSYDVKLIYLEFGLKGFEKGFDKCTEKRSDGEPRFSAQPALEYHTALRDMLVSSASGSPSLKIYFSVHRQVARTRTEEIGVGALPVRMLFSKVSEGWMDLPTKFKVPLANYKGVIRGKVLLRNIPQFSQLTGEDLMNVDGNIVPQTIDLSSRRLLPWVKLPRSVDSKLKTKSSPINQTRIDSGAAGQTTANGIGNQSEVKAVEKPTSPSAAFATRIQHHSSLTKSTSDGSDVSTASHQRKPRAKAYAAPYDETDLRRAYQERSQYSPAGAEEARKSATSPLAVRDQIYAAEPESSYDSAAEILRAKLEGRPVPARKSNMPVSGKADVEGQQAWMRGTTNEGRNEHDPEQSIGQKQQEWSGEIAGEERFGHETLKTGEGTRPQWERVTRREGVVMTEQLQGILALRMSDDSADERRDSNEGDEASSPVQYQEMTRWESSRTEENELGTTLRGRRSKSTKSFGSAGTGDGGVEIGSMVLSNGSDDGYMTGSRTTTEDALTMSQRFSTGPPSEERYELVDEEGFDREIEERSVATSGTYIGYSAEGLGEMEEEEWLAILDASSSRYYFAHRYTQESLWLPPEWERMEDDEGRQYFVDHGSRTTQREFPAAEARAYRESVYTSR